MIGNDAHAANLRRVGKARRAARLALLVVTAASAGTALAQGTFDVRNGTVAGGGGVTSAGNFRLVWTIGEPAMGTTSAGALRLTSGFPATIGDRDIQGSIIVPIFKDGFEGNGGAAP